jgi:hypothetical protein
LIASLQAADSLPSEFPALRTGLWNECAFGALENVCNRQPAAKKGLIQLPTKKADAGRSGGDFYNGS